MAKLALINREKKREATVAKFAAKRAALKAIINDATRSMEERMEARAQLQALPRDTSPVRLHPDGPSAWKLPQVRTFPFHDS